MAKLNGVKPREFKLGASATYASNPDVKNNVMSYEIEDSTETQDVSDLTNDVKQYIPLLGDVKLTVDSFVDDSSGSLFHTLKNDRGSTHYISIDIQPEGGTETGYKFQGAFIKTTMPITRGDDGSMTMKAEFVPSAGVNPSWS